MSLASRLYQLQETDSQLREKRRILKDTIHRLQTNEELSRAEAELASEDENLQQAQKQQRKLEWEVDDYTAKIADINGRLFGGKVTNPKELMALEQDVRGLKKHLSEKEEALLDAMGVSEDLDSHVSSLRANVETIKTAWNHQSQDLIALKSDTEADIARLTEMRATTRDAIESGVLLSYDQLSQSKGVAVIKVERGRCKGCNMQLPTGQWQRARAGEVIHCSSCGRILYVE
ncbi:MAG: hypothetical protein JW846_00540 [Dehalococcoidia bacterium]|nr:hypothetical protein [Dehalococcoidia bacterium]